MVRSDHQGKGVTHMAMHYHGSNDIICISEGDHSVYLNKREVVEAVEYLQYWLKYGEFPKDYSFVNKSHCDCYEFSSRVGVNVELVNYRVIKFFFTIEDVGYILNVSEENFDIQEPSNNHKRTIELEHDDGELLYSSVVEVTDGGKYKPLVDRLITVAGEVYPELGV